LLEREVLDAEDFDKLVNENKKSHENPELPEGRIDNVPNFTKDFLA